MQLGTKIVLAAGVVAMTGPVSGQAWIGQIVGQMAAQGREHQCMSGTVSTDKETAEARVPATVAMQSYFAAAHGQDRANVLAAFHQSPKNSWRRGGTTLQGSALATVTDPTARAAAALTPEPRRFVRAGDSGSAWGVWEVADARGRPAGTYLAGFKRQLGEWKLRSIEVDPASIDDASLAPYCHKQGDTAAYLAAIEANEAKRAAKKARKEAERAARGG